MFVDDFIMVSILSCTWVDFLLILSPEMVRLMLVSSLHLHNFLSVSRLLHEGFLFRLFLFLSLSLSCLLCLSLSLSLALSFPKNKTDLKNFLSSHSVSLWCDSHAEVLSGSCLFIHPFLHFVSPPPHTQVPLRPLHIPRVTQQVSRPINQRQAPPLCAANVINRC